MKTVKKAVAAVVRQRNGHAELLVFTHPLAGVQIPKGTVERGETLEQATLRELQEESGLALVVTPRQIGTWRRHVSGEQTKDRQPERHDWSVFILEAPGGLPEHWRHAAQGSPEEEGLVFAYHWLRIDDDLGLKLHPLFRDVAKMLVNHVG